MVWKMRTVLAGLALVAGCAGEDPVRARYPHCVAVERDFARDLLRRSPFDQLDDEVRDQIEGALQGPGKVCLSAEAEQVRCNAGDTRAADIRPCCRFTTPPGLRLLGVPERIRLDSRDGVALVDLKLAGSLRDLTLQSDCVAPVCGNDQAAAAADLRLSGMLRLSEQQINIDVTVELDERLQLDCKLPSSE